MRPRCRHRRQPTPAQPGKTPRPPRHRQPTPAQPGRKSLAWRHQPATRATPARKNLLPYEMTSRPSETAPLHPVARQPSYPVTAALAKPDLTIPLCQPHAPAQPQRYPPWTARTAGQHQDPDSTRHRPGHTKEAATHVGLAVRSPAAGPSGIDRRAPCPCWRAHGPQWPHARAEPIRTRLAPKPRPPDDRPPPRPAHIRQEQIRQRTEPPKTHSPQEKRTNRQTERPDERRAEELRAEDPKKPTRDRQASRP